MRTTEGDPAAAFDKGAGPHQAHPVLAVGQVLGVHAGVAQTGSEDLAVVGRVVGQHLPAVGGFEQLTCDVLQGRCVEKILVADSVHRYGCGADRRGGTHEGAEQDSSGEIYDADLDDFSEQVGGLGVQDHGILETEPGSGPAACLHGAKLPVQAAGGHHTEGRFLQGCGVTGGGHQVRSFAATTRRLVTSAAAGGQAGRAGGPDNALEHRHSSRGQASGPGTPCRLAQWFLAVGGGGWSGE